MRWLHLFYVGSFAAHAAFLGGLFVMKKPEPASEIVAVMMAQPKKKKDKPKPPEPPKPIEAPKEALQRPLAPRKAAPAPEAPPPPDPVAAAHPKLAGMQDFGISLSGGGDGIGGIAVPTGGGGGAVGPAAATVAKKEKVLGASAAKADAAGGADDAGELVKAKAVASSIPHNTRSLYTDDARAAGIEGRVRLELSLDDTGAVTSVKVLAGLGHGLDEAAANAARHMSFSPATRDGKPVPSKFVFTMRFELGG
jgi:protein TonB